MLLVLTSLFISIALGLSGFFTEALYLFFHTQPTRSLALIVDFIAAMISFIFTFYLSRELSKGQISFKKGFTNFRLSPSLLFGSAVIIFSGLITAAYFITISRQFPLGAWDAIALYNSKARFIAHSSLPIESFFSLNENLRHDAPLAISAIVANWWAVVPSDHHLAPAIINSLYLFSLAIFVAGLLSLHHHWLTALFGLLAVLSCNKLIYTSAIQYCDVPVSCYFTQALGFLYLAFTTLKFSRFSWVTIALLAGFCALTKNEGIAMSVVITLTTIFTALLYDQVDINRAPLGKYKGLAMNILAYGLTWCLIFSPTYQQKKMAGMVVNHMLAGNSFPLLIEKLTNTHRYEVIGKYLILYLPEVGGILSLVLLITLVLSVLKPSRLRLIKIAFLFATLAMFGVYLLVFLFTQIEIEKHVRSALDRLLVQLWAPFVITALIGVECKLAGNSRPFEKRYSLKISGNSC